MDPLGPSILAALFLCISGFVYSLNAALPSVAEGDLDKQAEGGSTHAKRVRRLLDRFDHGYGEIRMTYVLLLICAFECLWAVLEAPFRALLGLSALPCALIGAAIFGILAFTLTAIIPAGIAAHAPERSLRVVSPLAEAAIIALSPITRGAWWIGKLLLKPFHIDPGFAAERVSEEEILQMVDIGEEKGEIETDEKEMIENIFEFNNMTAEDCMVHRKDITAIDVDASGDEVLSIIEESGLSRFPVYEDGIDNVIGILTSRDFLIARCAEHSKPWRMLIRPAHFVPESVRTDVLFREMQTRKQHMAIVIDEYGGTSGLITLEDLLEEIVGNIYDEFDPKEEQEITPLPDGRWRISGSTELEAIHDALQIELPLDEEYDTLGGLIFSHLTEIPADGEKPVVECFGLRISVTEVADRRVEWAIVEKLPPSSEDLDKDSKG
ncbi:MAG: HlyC/CorC family transporter [Clostridia bacterium]|nr:HlyC/CorC family transporter [Clostridia bacterium]